MPQKMSELPSRWSVGKCFYTGGLVRCWSKSPSSARCTVVSLVWVTSYRAVIKYLWKVMLFRLFPNLLWITRYISPKYQDLGIFISSLLLHPIYPFLRTPPSYTFLYHLFSFLVRNLIWGIRIRRVRISSLFGGTFASRFKFAFHLMYINSWLLVGEFSLDPKDLILSEGELCYL